MQSFLRSTKHARSFEFTKKQVAMYQDNSLEKASRIRSLLNTRGTEFSKKERLLKDLITKKQNMRVKRVVESKMKGIIETNIKEYNNWQEKLNRSAIIIQKNIRGYLVRKKCDKMLSVKVKKQANQCVDRMHKMIYSMWIDLKYFKEPARIIESHYLRYKGRIKIAAALEIYSKYCYDRKAERFRVFEYIQHMINRERLWQIKQPLLIKRRLEAIKKNLSLLKVKYYWTKNKLTPVKIIAKARKLKKILGATKKIQRTSSYYKEKLPSPFIWRYSMLTLPIIYNENILLGSETVPKSTRNARSRIMRKRITNNLSPTYTNLPSIGSSSAKSRSNRKPPSRNLIESGKKIEVIQYHSPMAESLGYKSFNLKVWKPIFGLSVEKGSLSPIFNRQSFMKSSRLKSPNLLPMRDRKK